MKIFVLTPGIFPDSHSGVPKFVFYSTRELQKFGHEIVVLTRKYNDNHYDKEVIDGMHYNRAFIPKRGDLLNKLWPVIMPIKSILWQKKIKKNYKQFDLIWIHNPWWVLFLNPKKLWPDAKILYTFYFKASDEIISNNGNSIKSKFLGALYDSIARLAMMKADIVFAISKFVYDQCITSIGEKNVDKVKIIPGGANMDIFYPASNYEKEMNKRELGIPVDRPVFITSRGLKGRTGVDKLVKAAYLLKNKGVSFYLNITGSGPMRQHIENLIVKLDLNDCVKMVGYLEDESDLAEYYRASDVFVLPTQSAEGFGLSTVEALATGLVVLGTDNSATTEILEKYNHKWLINGIDEYSIYKKMYEYCSDPENISLPQEKIRQITINNYTWDISAKSILNAINLNE